MMLADAAGADVFKWHAAWFTGAACVRGQTELLRLCSLAPARHSASLQPAAPARSGACRKYFVGGPDGASENFGVSMEAH